MKITIDTEDDDLAPNIKIINETTLHTVSMTSGVGNPITILVQPNPRCPKCDGTGVEAELWGDGRLVQLNCEKCNGTGLL